MFVAAVKPVVYIAAETELWPNLFARLSREGVPILVVNGRISDEAFPKYRMVKGLLRRTLRSVRMFCMQSATDAERVLALGVDSKCVKMAGNIKFDNAPEARGMLARDIGFEDKDVILVGGSTHPGEEEILLDVFLGLRQAYPDLRLILAPRHPERAKAVAKAVRAVGLAPRMFSGGNSRLTEQDVLIVDTIGHLLTLYSVATIVFVGKSLTVKGGHNIIEPAVFARPVIIGPHTENFKDITQVFLKQHAVIQVKDAVGLKDAVQGFLRDKKACLDIGARARAVVRSHQGATVRTMDIIHDVIEGRV
ncbi:MAG: hypothetical protein HQL19_06515, partial [Candidatus Omnitrophica bacterium]|nr:hypothetical protein [Candidatus Omnitrophota bacterium]